jgi:hypothetical protein
MSDSTTSTFGNPRLWTAVANLAGNSSRDAIDSYMQALINLELAFPCRTVAGNIEIKLVRFPGLDGECLPVFSDDASWQAFRPVLHGYDEVRRMRSVHLYRFVIEKMLDVGTVLIDPARPDFLRIPRSTIAVLAESLEIA